MIPPLAKRKGPTKPRPSNDEIRWRILRLLYDERVASGTRRRFLWSELRKKVRTELELPPAETTHNLEYLVQSGWVEKEIEPYTGPRSRTFGTMRELYTIAAKAVDLFENGSIFSSSPPVQELVIAGDHNIVQVGPNAYAHVRYGDLQSALQALLQAATLSEELSPDQKLQVMADGRAIQAQLLKPDPDKTILNRLKEGVGWLADIASLSNFVANVLRLWPF